MSEPEIARVFTIRYRNAFGDMLRFRFVHRMRSPVVLGLLPVWLALCSVGFYLVFSRDGSMAARILTVFFADCITFGVLTALGVMVNVLDLMSRRNKTLFTEYTLTVDQNGLTSESQYAKSEMKWSIVQRLVRTKRFVLVYITGNTAFLVPRRAFRDDAEWDVFYEYCRQRTQPA